MTQQIGTVDSDLRELIYAAFARWMIDHSLDVDLMKQITELILDDNHLFLRIGNSDDDTVFTRSFSVLFIPLIFIYNQKSNILTETDYEEIYTKVIRYFNLEEDLRGYVLYKGWAHAIAHAADALESIAASSYYSEHHLFGILEVIQQKTLNNNKYYYMDNEDDRLARAVVQVIRKKLIKNDLLINWIKQFKNIKIEGKLPEDNIIRGNTKNFLRSIYFKLLKLDSFEELTNEIIIILNDFQK
ncbi:hypothetical protein D3C73_959350 [compost metagenome]